MTKASAFLFLFLCVAGVAKSTSTNQEILQTTNYSVQCADAELQISTQMASVQLDKIMSEQYSKSGCCSWHSGVCGCSMGRAKCCDGTLSPSCGCD